MIFVKPETRLDELDLTVRAWNVLRAELGEEATAGDVAALTREDLLGFPNMGRKTVTHIREAISPLALRQQPPAVRVVRLVGEDGRILWRCDDRERMEAVIRARMGGETLQGIADAYGIHRERVRQILESGKRFARRAIRVCPEVLDRYPPGFQDWIDMRWWDYKRKWL